MDATAPTPKTQIVGAPDQRVLRGPLAALGTFVMGLALVASGIALVWMLVLAMGFYNTPFLGVLINHAFVVSNIKPAGAQSWNGFTAGIKPRDQITRIKLDAGTIEPDVLNADAIRKLSDLLASSARGQIAVIDIIRPPGLKTAQPGCEIYTSDGILCQFQVVLAQYPLVDLLGNFVVAFVVGAIFYLAGLVTFIRAWRSPAVSGRLIGTLCATLGVVVAGQFDLTTTHQTSLLWALCACIAGGSAFHLALVFPYEIVLLRRMMALRFGSVVFALLSFAACYAAYVQRGVPTIDGIQLVVIPILLAALLMLMMSLTLRRIQSPSPIAREQSGAVLVALVIALSPFVLWVATYLIDRAFNLPTFTFAVWLAFPPLLIIPAGFLYALSEQQLLNTDVILREAAIYGILGAALVFGYSAITFGLYLATASVVRWDNPILIALTIFIIAVGFVPVRLRLERLLDRTFFRKRLTYEQSIESFARKLTTVIDSNDAGIVLQRQIEEDFSPLYSFVFLRNPLTGEFEAANDWQTGKRMTDIHFSPSSPLLTYMGNTAPILYMAVTEQMPSELSAERARLALLGTPVIARLRSSSRLNGFIALGPRRDKSIYVYEDLRYIEGLADQAALAFERTQVIVEAQRNERELRVLSQVSAALNITMDFETLLEFIYTQTDKVISADYFFIALVSPASKEVYFAFYQERNERNQQKEGTAWPIAGDLFSEVITSQQPLKTDNYSVEAARRGMNPLGSLPIRAWAGVPLNAGTGSALGVLAIASTDAAVAFTEDQVSIFASIADLAATALDKARLFRETDERARQLTVLNDISTQLASEFEHIEALLGIITQSAVDILSAEAGSLLLADEQSGDLVFEVVIGGAGQNLIGTRIPPGVGIVGRVVETGRYVIVNEARKNPDWFGEVVDVRDGDAAAASFRTDSILAVPLTARGHVIGVLELINKRDRSAWVDNDVNLLTTFASQAAIAIENARLFRMTDEQLGLRVQQLDNMARIDQELNRTLDLRAVIDLTLDNALRESGADAGALALVRSDPLGFEVIGSVGYPLGTFTKDEVYPIDLGVIGRVYRTGSPSLVTELDEDPDYVETLPNAVGQLAVPMITAGKGVTAVLLLETREEGVFTMMNMSFIMALAEHANTAITNSQLFTQLQQANSARTQFVGFVAHELKNPMASIKGYSETLLAGMTGPLTDVQKNFVNTISRNVARMQQIVDDLRDLTALETGVLTVRTRPISFNNVIFESLRPLQRQIDEKGQSMYLEVPDNLPLVAGDEGRLIQVLTNFLSNASKYTPEGGSITVYAEATNNQWDADGAPEVIHCSVRDTGIGISQEDLKLLATPYFRSTNPLAQAETGTGLGMTITYALIEAHGGLVWVESEIGQGSTFHFTVPLALQTEVN